MTSPEIKCLTSLRFVAAFYVFLFHFHIRWPLTPYEGLNKFLSHGAYGMTLFFVLSGFVLSYRFKDGITDTKNYLFDRFTRIYPAYVLAAISTIPWLIITMHSHGVSPEKYALIILANIFLLQAWVPVFFLYWNNGGSWSISVEAFFYIMFPFVINKIKSLKNRDLMCLLFIFYVFTSYPGIAATIFKPTQPFTVFYAIPIYRVSEFIIGVLCGALFIRGIKIAKPSQILIITLLLFYQVINIFNFEYEFITENYLVVPVATLLIWCCASLEKGYVYKFFCNKIFMNLGKISYSFYSFQGLVILSLAKYHDQIVAHIPYLKANRKMVVVTFLVLTLIASLSYYFVEVRLRRRLKSGYFSSLFYKPATS